MEEDGEEKKRKEKQDDVDKNNKREPSCVEMGTERVPFHPKVDDFQVDDRGELVPLGDVVVC